MTNALHRDIKDGEVIVLKKEIFKPEYQEFKWRLVRVFGGFGMAWQAAGRKIFVEFLEDGEKVMYDATTSIDVKETEEYQKSQNK